MKNTFELDTYYFNKIALYAFQSSINKYTYEPDFRTCSFATLTETTLFNIFNNSTEQSKPCLYIASNPEKGFL